MKQNWQCRVKQALITLQYNAAKNASEEYCDVLGVNMNLKKAKVTYDRMLEEYSGTLEGFLESAMKGSPNKKAKKSGAASSKD